MRETYLKRNGRSVSKSSEICLLMTHFFLSTLSNTTSCFEWVQHDVGVFVTGGNIGNVHVSYLKAMYLRQMSHITGEKKKSFLHDTFLQ